MVTTTETSANDSTKNEFVYVTNLGEGHTLAPDVDE